MKRQYPILSKGESAGPQVQPPAPHGAALFYTARWHVWRIGGVPTLYERRPVKVRATEKDRPHVQHHDTIRVCELASPDAIDSGIDHETLAAARDAVREHERGLT